MDSSGTLASNRTLFGLQPSELPAPRSITAEMLASGAAWAVYTPTLTAAGVNPTMGTGALRKGRWQRDARMISGWANIKFGTSGAAPGTGVYQLSLPVPPRQPDLTTEVMVNAGTIHCVDNSSGDVFTGTALSLATADFIAFQIMGHGNVADGTPFTWANNDQIYVAFHYEAAS